MGRCPSPITPRVLHDVRITEKEATLTRYTYRRVMRLVREASAHQRGAWWCNLNGWRWPVEWPSPRRHPLTIPREQYRRLMDGCEKDGGSSEAARIWSDRIRRGVCTSTGAPMFREVRYDD